MPVVNAGFPQLPGATPAQSLAGIGPTIFVHVGLEDQNWPKDGSTPPNAGSPVAALVDTGASECCIDDQLAVSLGLPVIDQMMIAGAGGSHTVNVYLGQVVCPPLNRHIYGRFAGVHLSAGGQLHQVLIGRSFLNGVVMVYDGITGIVQICA